MKTVLIIISLGLFLVSCKKEPEACIQLDESVYYVDQIISFSNCSENAQNFYWDFGNGNTSSELSPNCSYINEGIYTVTLKAYSKNEKSYNDISRQIRIYRSTQQKISKNWKIKKYVVGLEFSNQLIDKTYGDTKCITGEYITYSVTNEKIYNYNFSSDHIDITKHDKKTFPNGDSLYYNCGTSYYMEEDSIFHYSVVWDVDTSINQITITKVDTTEIYDLHTINDTVMVWKGKDANVISTIEFVSN